MGRVAIEGCQPRLGVGWCPDSATRYVEGDGRRVGDCGVMAFIEVGQALRQIQVNRAIGAIR